MASLNRRIIFGRLQLPGNTSFQLAPALNYINGLAHAPNGRYMPWANGEQLTCWIDRMGATPSFRMAKLRSRGLPPVAQGATITDLQIPAGASLAEQTHMVYFPQQEIIGIEMNPDGPRPPSIRGYLQDRLQPTPDNLAFYYLVNREILERLERLEFITKFNLKIRKNHLEALQGTSATLQRAVKACLDNGPEVVELTLSCEPRSKHDIGQTLLNDAKHFAEDPTATGQTVDKLQVEGYEDGATKVTVIDLLSDKLLVRKDMAVIERPHSVHVDSEAAYKAIREAYSDLRTDLANAGGASA